MPRNYSSSQTTANSYDHKLTPDGLKADESKIEAIAKMSPPKTETDLKSFLGMVNYLG